MTIRYEGTLHRPPSEGESLILQATIGWVTVARLSCPASSLQAAAGDCPVDPKTPGEHLRRRRLDRKQTLKQAAAEIGARLRAWRAAEGFSLVDAESDSGWMRTRVRISNTGARSRCRSRWRLMRRSRIDLSYPTL